MIYFSYALYPSNLGIIAPHLNIYIYTFTINIFFITILFTILVVNSKIYYSIIFIPKKTGETSPCLSWNDYA